jgi:uncharacterized protein YjbI with pentapeptide repeats
VRGDKNKAAMANMEHVGILRKGKEVWKKWRLENPAINPDLSNFNFNEDLNIYSIFHPAAGPHIGIAKDFDFSNVNFEGSCLSGIVFHDCHFNGAIFKNADISRNQFFRCTFFKFYPFLDRLGKKREYNVCMDYANFDHANASSSTFSNVSLIHVDFTNIIVNHKTKFIEVDVAKCKVRNRQLDGLHEYGGLSLAQVSTMWILDDLQILRAQFSGFWNWIHLSCLIGFCAPYFFVYFATMAVSKHFRFGKC